MIKVCHVTSVHPKEDIRIFQKQCVALAKAGYDVYLVQQGVSYEKTGVHIVGFGEIASNRIRRLLKTSLTAIKTAEQLDADVYHIHDPELLFYAMRLKKKGKTVIFDSHEDIPADISQKGWIPGPFRAVIAKVYEAYERYCLSRLDGVIGVTPSLFDRLRRMNRHCAMITNYPILEEGLPQPKFDQRKLIFPGVLNGGWNIEKVIPLLDTLGDVTLEIRSRHVGQAYLDSLKQLPGWEKVNFSGAVPHSEIMRLMSECMCGLALCEPCPNTGGKLGTLGNTKIFEYMMAGLPVVCTDFVLWKEIVYKYQCGICVDTENIEQIQNAIRYILEHPEEARRMGENGRRAIKEEFNWGVEEKKLLALYEDILK